jgi:hypothetical protein
VQVDPDPGASSAQAEDAVPRLVDDEGLRLLIDQDAETAFMYFRARGRLDDLLIGAFSRYVLEGTSLLVADAIIYLHLHNEPDLRDCLGIPPDLPVTVLDRPDFSAAADRCWRLVVSRATLVR